LDDNDEATKMTKSLLDKHGDIKFDSPKANLISGETK